MRTRIKFGNHFFRDCSRHGKINVDRSFQRIEFLGTFRPPASFPIIQFAENYCYTYAGKAVSKSHTNRAPGQLILSKKTMEFCSPHRPNTIYPLNDSFLYKFDPLHIPKERGDSVERSDLLTWRSNFSWPAIPHEEILLAVAEPVDRFASLFTFHPSSASHSESRQVLQDWWAAQTEIILLNDNNTCVEGTVLCINQSVKLLRLFQFGSLNLI